MIKIYQHLLVKGISLFAFYIETAQWGWDVSVFVVFNHDWFKCHSIFTDQYSQIISSVANVNSITNPEWVCY